MSLHSVGRSPVPLEPAAPFQPPDVDMPDALAALDSAQKTDGLKRKIREEEETPPSAKRARYEPLPPVSVVDIPEVKKPGEKGREYAAWVSGDTNFLMRALPQHQIALDPFRSIAIDVVTGEDRTVRFVIPLVLLTNLSAHFQTTFMNNMHESATGSIVWKGIGADPFIHEQAAVHIIQYAHLKCRALEKEKCQTLRQIKQGFPEDFDKILGDIVRLCSYLQIEDLKEICQEFIAEECKTDPSAQIPEYLQWALGRLETRPVFRAALQALAKDPQERGKIYPVLVDIFLGNFSDCSLEEKLVCRRFVRECFFEILPDEPDDEELLDIYSIVADLFPDFDFSPDQMAQIAAFTFSSIAQQLSHPDPHLQRKQNASIVGEFFQRALNLMYKGKAFRVPYIEWGVHSPLEEKYSPYRLLLYILRNEDHLMPNAIIWLSDFLSTYPQNIFALKMRSMMFADSDLNAALRDIEKALGSYPDDPDLLTMRGVYLYERGEQASTLRDLNRALEIHPRFIPAYLQRSYFHHEEGNGPKAIADIDRAIEVEPSPFHFKHRAWLHYLWGNYDQAFQDITRAYRSQMKDAEILLIRGLIQKAKKNFTEALNDHTMACHRGSHLPYLWIARGMLYQENGQFDQALADFNQGVILARRESQPRAHSPFFPFKVELWTPYLKHGQCLLEMGEPVKALEDFTYVLQNYPENIPALLGISKCRSDQGDLYGTWEFCLNAIAIDRDAVRQHLQSSLEKNPNDSRSLALLACYHAEIGEDREALELFDLALSQPSPHPHVRVLQAGVHAERGNPGAAIHSCNAAIATELKPYPLIVRARAFLRKSDFVKALADVNLAIECSQGKDHTACLLKMLLLLKERNLSQLFFSIGSQPLDRYALLTLEREIRLYPKEPDVYFLKALLFWFNKNYLEAEQDLDTVLKMRPEDCRAMVIKAHCSRKLNYLQSFELMLDTALAADDHPQVFFTLDRALKPSSPIDFFVMRGYCHFRLGKHVDAILDFKNALKHNPGEHYALRLRSKCYRLLGKEGAAWDDCQELIDLGQAEEILSDINEEIDRDPLNRILLTLRARFNMQTGNLFSAIADCTTVLHFAPDDDEACLLRGKCYQIQGEVDLAWQDFVKAIEVGLEQEVLNFFKFCEFTYSEDPLPLIFLGRYYLKNSDLIRASIHFEKALGLQPGNLFALQGQTATFEAAKKSSTKF